jgi:hypothetical protein
MKKHLMLLLVFVFATSLLSNGQFLKKAQSLISQKGGGLTESQAADGIKEALVKGAEKGVSLISRRDGFLGNPEIKIPFPQDAKVMESKLRSLGFGKKVDEVTNSINRAAEDAASQAKPIFVEAIKGMSVTDAINIVKGSNDAATQYLRSNTSSAIAEKFRPSIKSSLDKVSATRYWTDLVNLYNKIPGIKKMNPDLTGYVTGKAIDGLFVMIAKEEKNIRENPAAQTSDLLKKVFGSK